ncbi:SNF2-related protein [Actinopolyspora saharensis]|uniref:SNF2-related protein n=1 Tax=Actinopolyspora saharensis TaxID=995062 RepID=UPI003F674C5B
MVVRDEQWLVRKVVEVRDEVWMLEVTGVSSFVRGTEAVFYTELDDVRVLDPRETELVADDSPNHRRARLYLEAIIRKSSLPQTEHGLALADYFLMDPQPHQLRPAELALSMANPQPRLLIADAVGLGKTLEIGVLLAELIRRGRGERILVVTPQHVLEQFQRELWTRFAIPLVRLDSTGIQRMQQEIPAGRNPFTYFKRVIISVDTLKNQEQYAHHLEKTKWDAVVIDESHNLIARGSKRNELARLLAPNTDALVLASATPHNGDAKSFAELINLLDPAAIADPAQYDTNDLDHLYIRRTKTTPEVRDSFKKSWADRGPSLPVHARASAAEEKVFTELAERWLSRDGVSSSSRGGQLFPYTLLKAFLSSHEALLETISERLRRTTDRTDPQTRTERQALEELSALAGQITSETAAKFRELVNQLRELGVGPASGTRVVVFSERVRTLRWLAETVPAELGFVKNVDSDPRKPWLAYGDGFGGSAVQVMHGDANTDQEQMAIVEKFGLREDPVRLLFTGDLASEGINLHQQCHLLVHYDLPWSLIRIEQRNGRIDRYGQTESPEFRALILTSEAASQGAGEIGGERYLDDRLVGEKLLEREAQAHRIEGSAEAVTGLYRAKDEEDRLTQDLIAGRTTEQSIEQSRDAGSGFLADLLGQVGAAQRSNDVPRAVVPGLFEGTEEYFDAATRQICRTTPEDELDLRWDEDGTIAFEPPRDLLQRLKSLPKSYLEDQSIMPGKDSPGRIRVTFDKNLAQRRLDAARQSSHTQWPNVSYLTDIHPVLEWLTDKVLVEIGRHEAPVLGADVSDPVFLVQGTYSNKFGRPTVMEWIAVTARAGGQQVEFDTERMTEDFLRRCGVGPMMPGRSTPHDRATLQGLVPRAVDAAHDYLAQHVAAYDEQIDEALEPYRARVRGWQESLFAASRPRRESAERTASHQFDLVQSLRTRGEPMLRLLAVLEGTTSDER